LKHGIALSSLLCTALLLTQAGCANVKQAPYQRADDTPYKAEWSRPAGAASTVSADSAITLHWWTYFRDPTLDTLVNRAIAGNFDLKALAARVDVAQALIGEARAGALPTVDIGAGASFERSTGQRFSKQFSLGTQVNWDLDIWGRVQKGVQAQTSEFNASEADWRAGWLVLASSVSTTYFQILASDEQIEQQQIALDKSRRVLGIFETMRDSGLVPATQVLRQRAEINRLTKELIELRRFRDVAENALATLVGTPAGQFKLPAGRLQERVQIPSVPTGMPIDLLARRPDVVAAEHRVLAAHDLVGVAKLAQLPSIGFGARAGSSAFSVGDLLKSFTLGFLPSINIPAFNPSIKARIATSTAQSRAVEQDYKATVLSAYEEVENALVNLESHRLQREELHSQAEQLHIVAQQTEAQLRAGLVSQLDLFETERSLLAARLALLAVHQQVLADTVTLYKALGGGWTPVKVADARR
jgi:NodT family efflux transporter outer membrane factor (OMF) lipoprotein